MESRSPEHYKDSLQWVAEVYGPEVHTLCNRYIATQQQVGAVVDLEEFAYQADVYLHRRELERLLDIPSDSRLVLE